MSTTPLLTPPLSLAHLQVTATASKEATAAARRANDAERVADAATAAKQEAEQAARHSQLEAARLKVQACLARRRVTAWQPHRMLHWSQCLAQHPFEA